MLVAIAGDITLNDGSDADGMAVSANGIGSILVDALAGNVTANADILSGTGHITMKADDNIALTAGVDVTTASAGTISIDAETGALTMAGTANVAATTSSARLRAEGDITVGNVTATNVSIDSDAGSIVNAAGSTKNVTATNLRLQADGGIGTSARHLTTNIDTVTALAATGSMYLTEDDGVTVADVTVSVTDFNADASTTVVTDAAQSDLITGADGNIVLVAIAGDITLNDGSDADGMAVSANGIGSILVDALAGNVTANADILSGTGHITIKAETDVNFAGMADIVSGGAGAIDVQATDGAILLSTTSNQTTGSGDILFSAGTNVTLGGTAITTGSISVTAGGWIHDGDIDGGIDLVSSGLQLESGGDIGLLGSSTDNPIETDVDILSARVTGTGDIHVTEADDVVLRDVSTVDGSIVINTRNGSIVIEDGDDGDNLGVRAGGNGDIDLEADSIFFNSGVSTTGGDITVVAVNDIVQNAGSDITSTSGNIQIKTFGAFQENGRVDSDTGEIAKVDRRGAVFIWNAVADVDLYYVTIEKDGQPYGTLWIYGETEWCPQYDLPYGDYQIKVYPTIPSGYKDTIEFPVVRIENPAAVSSTAIASVPDAVAREPLNSEIVVSENENIDKNIQGEAEEATRYSASDLTVLLAAGSYGGSRHNTDGDERAALEANMGVRTGNDENIAGESTNDIIPAVSSSEKMSVDTDGNGLVDDDAAGTSDDLSDNSAVIAAVPERAASDTEKTPGDYANNSYLKALVRYGRLKGLPQSEIADSGNAVSGISSGLWSDLSDTASQHLFGKTSGRHNLSGLKGLMAPDPEDTLHIMDTLLSGEGTARADQR